MDAKTNSHVIRSSKTSESIGRPPIVVRGEGQNDEGQPPDLWPTRASQDTGNPPLNPHDPKERQPDSGINTLVQILMAACSMGIEMCATFVQIFAVLYLQFLGVPTVLVSMNGVISGGTSLVLLPVVGWFSDRGSNPVGRKLTTMFLCLIVYLFGLSGITFCGISKIIYFKDILENTEIVELNVSSGSSLNGTWNSTEMAQSWENSNLEISNIPEPIDILSSTPVSAYLAIVCFALLDIGFDISMALSRSFMLECVPAFQHTRILLVASAIQSLSGLIFSFMGTIDFASQLSAMFDVNGTAAGIVFFAVFLATVVVVGFSCTMITGYVLLKRKHEVRQRIGQDIKDDKVETSSEIQTSKNKFRQMWQKMSERKRLKKTLSVVNGTDGIKENGNDLRPLLTEDRAKANSYLSISSRPSSVFNMDNEKSRDSNMSDTGSDSEEHTDTDMSMSVSHEVNKSLDGKSNSCRHGIEDASSIEKSPFVDSLPRDCDIEKNIPTRRKQKRKRVYRLNDATTAIGAFKASYSMSLSLAHSNFGRDTPSYRLGLAQTQKSTMAAQPIRKPQSNNRLIVLCVSTFLTVGSMLCSITYTGNALTIDIYHGIPTALPGTDGYRLYRKGLTDAAWGNFALYATFTLVSLCNKKIIDLIGEKFQFVLSHVIFISCYAGLLLVKSEELFFVSMTVSGLNRVCVYTLPYILATKFTQDEGESGPTMNKGKVMTLIGFLIPLHYIIISAMMGPLMEVTNNVWVPTIYSVVTALVAVPIFSLLFVVKY